mmetsp:Transcript_11106/g.21763  ORF Transcript_11106/g.21763 Transcript_11106/m.21763 type:complete len:101 (-) Transcript_11106:1102-1404(-)
MGCRCPLLASVTSISCNSLMYLKEKSRGLPPTTSLETMITFFLAILIGKLLTTPPKHIPEANRLRRNHGSEGSRAGSSISADSKAWRERWRRQDLNLTTI